MKRLKFLIVALGVFAAQGVFAVTLPSTSYNPYGGTADFASESVIGSGTLITGSFQSASAGPYAVCESATVCEDCCNNNFGVEACMAGGKTYTECAQINKDCVTACEKGPSIPLDAPLWFMLVIAVLSVTLRACARRVSQAAKRTE